MPGEGKMPWSSGKGQNSRPRGCRFESQPRNPVTNLKNQKEVKYFCGFLLLLQMYICLPARTFFLFYLQFSVFQILSFEQGILTTKP